jgi:predicted nucleic acid-binding protein
MLYLDTSALVKFIRRETESDALADWLDARFSQPWVSSTLIEVELPRALRPTEPGLLPDVPGLIARIARYEIVDARREAARHRSRLFTLRFRPCSAAAAATALPREMPP